MTWVCVEYVCCNKLYLAFATAPFQKPLLPSPVWAEVASHSRIWKSQIIIFLVYFAAQQRRHSFTFGTLKFLALNIYSFFLHSLEPLFSVSYSGYSFYVYFVMFQGYIFWNIFPFIIYIFLWVISYISLAYLCFYLLIFLCGFYLVILSDLYFQYRSIFFEFLIYIST